MVIVAEPTSFQETHQTGGTMDHSTFRIIYGIVFAAIIIFYLYGKTWKLNEVRDELTDMRVNDPTNPTWLLCSVGSTSGTRSPAWP
jgi:hypothetical protein